MLGANIRRRGLLIPRRYGGPNAKATNQTRQQETTARQLIRGVDFISRRLLGIIDFDSSDDCLLRIGRRRIEQEVRLSDGTLLRAGDAVVELHLWNEHLAIPDKGHDLRWAIGLRRQFRRSLQRLADHIVKETELSEVRALMIIPALTGDQQRKNLQRIPFLLQGDWTAVPRELSVFQLAHRLADSLWLCLLTWAFNPYKLKSGHFLHYRQEFWISRERFLSLYRAEHDVKSLASGTESSRPQ